MTTINNDYKISRLPNTFYRISKISHFFSDDTYKHCMYINGIKKSIGIAYTYDISLTYKNFVSLLNSFSCMDIKDMMRLANDPKLKKFIAMLNCLSLKKIIGDIQTSSPVFIFVNDGNWRLNGHFEQEIYKENGKFIENFTIQREYCAILFSGDFKLVNLDRDEYLFLVNYIRAYYLINLHWMTDCIGFPIGNDTSCIKFAHNKGWI